MSCPLATRFWAKVQSTAECWIWKGSQDGHGYGSFFVGPKPCSPSKAHRVAWILTRGDIPPGACVLHKCDNRGCVNPSHLWLGTIADNNHDMAAKGRANPPHWMGEHHPRARLTDLDVQNIRQRYAKGNMTHLQLAKEYQVHKSTVGYIIRGKLWPAAYPKHKPKAKSA